MEKVLLLLGGGPSQKQVIDAVKKMGYGLELLQCSYGKKSKLLNESEYCALDLGKEVGQIRTCLRGRKLAGVVNRYDSYIPLHGMLVDEFGVAGPSLKAARVFRYKTEMHEMMVENGLAMHRPWAKVVPLEEVETFLGEVSWPCVVKPTIGAKSRGVWVLQNKDDWYDAKTRIKKHYSDPKMKRILEKMVVLVEEYIDGFQIAPVTKVDAQGKVEIVGGVDVRRGPDVGEKHIQNVYRTTPSMLSDEKMHEVEKLLQHLMDLTGLRSSFLDPELYVLKDRLVVIEINVRLGGFRDRLFELAYGVDLNKALIDLALGMRVDLDKKWNKSVTACEVWDDDGGELQKMKLPDGYEYFELKLPYKEGDVYIPPPEGDKPLASFYLVDDTSSIDKAIKMRQEVEVSYKKS